MKRIRQLALCMLCFSGLQFANATNGIDTIDNKTFDNTAKVLGKWNFTSGITQANSGSDLNGGRAECLTNDLDTATLMFNGIAVELFVKQVDYPKLAKVLIDGAYVETINMGGTPGESRKKFAYVTPTLDLGDHMLQLIPTDNPDVSEFEVFIIDFARVFNSLAVAPKQTLAAFDTSVIVGAPVTLKLSNVPVGASQVTFGNRLKQSKYTVEGGFDSYTVTLPEVAGTYTVPVRIIMTDSSSIFANYSINVSAVSAADCIDTIDNKTFDNTAKVLGKWNFTSGITQANSGSDLNGGRAECLTNDLDTATLMFNGIAVELFVKQVDYPKLAKVLIDGAYVETINMGGTPGESRKKFAYVTPTLDLGDHMLQLIPTDNPDVSEFEVFIIDFARVFNSLAVAPKQTLAAFDTSVIVGAPVTLKLSNVPVGASQVTFGNGLKQSKYTVEGGFDSYSVTLPEVAGTYTVPVRVIMTDSSSIFANYSINVVAGNESSATLTDPVIANDQIFNTPFYKETLKVDAMDLDGIAKVSFLINDGKDLWVATDTESPYEFKYWYTSKDGANTFKVVVEDLLGNKDTIQIANFYVNYAPTIEFTKGLDKILYLQGGEILANDYELSARSYDKEDTDADSIAFLWHTYGPDKDSILGGQKSNIASVTTDLPVGTNVIKVKAFDKDGRNALSWAVVEVKADSIQDAIIENNAEGWMINRDWNPAEHLDVDSWNSVTNSKRIDVKIINLWDAVYAKRMFIGNKLQVIGVKQPGMGSLAIIVDGVPLDTVNCDDLAENATADAVLFSTESLSNTTHSLKLSKVAGDWVEINYLIVNEIKLPGDSHASLTEPVIELNQVFDAPFYNETLKVDAEDADGIVRLTFMINEGTDKWLSIDSIAPYEFKYWYSPLDGFNNFKVIVEDQLGNNDTIQLANFYVNYAPTLKYMKGLDQLLILNSDEQMANDFEIKARGYDKENVDADSIAFYWHTYSPDKDSTLGGLKSNIVSVKTDLPIGTHVLKAKVWDNDGRNSTVWAVTQIKADSAQNDTIENNAEGWMINRDWNPSEHLDSDSWNSVTNSKRTGVKVINLWDAVYAKRMFLGNKLQVIGVKQPGMGSLAIIIDGKAVDTLDCNDVAENATYEAVLFSTESLSDGAHSLQLSKVSGDWVEINHLIVNEIKPSTTGVSNLVKSVFTVYPNPATDILYFNENASAILYNLQGITVRSVINSASMNVGDLADGVYILRSGNNIVKLVVQ